ncbi:MAG: trypsin-like peptidase domain-containing protein [Acidobacteriota bacterium]|nr:trypsin-like peptidase domain-containing protein [Blastocatellia bacterium]MDW8412178.1 trypsin-like peptidase domain-containing protein [Acidobacteriota bacterium]
MKVTFLHITGKKQGAREIFGSFPIKVGRSSSSDLILHNEDTRASSRHAEVHCEGNVFVLKDIGSANGTFVNGELVRTSVIKRGDVIQFGIDGPKVLFEGIDDRVGYGKDTVQLMVDKALEQSSRKWKLYIFALLLGMVFTIYMLLKDRRLENDMVKGMSFSEIAERNKNSVVLVYNRFRIYDGKGKLLGEQVSNGSGFVISEKGEILTNRHVVVPWLYAEIFQGTRPLASAVTGKPVCLGVFFVGDLVDESRIHKVVDYELSDVADIAKLRVVTDRRLTPVSEMNEKIEELHQGDEIAVIGFPLGTELNKLVGDKYAKSSLTRGVISKISSGNQKQIQLDVAAYEGSSGAPVFNDRGQVIGVLTSGANDTLNFAIPIRYAKFWKKS